MSVDVVVVEENSNLVVEITSPNSVEITEGTSSVIEVTSPTEIELDTTTSPVVIEVGIGGTPGRDAVQLIRIATRNLSSQVDGIRTHFTIPQVFVADSLEVFINGLKENAPSITEDLTHDGFSLNFIIGLGNELFVSYFII